jgi:DNA adenine methylase
VAVRQMALFGGDGEGILDAIVNVASVPQRSPFRYPGGKTWLVPHIRRWLKRLPVRPTTLIEPFAGGGIVGLTVAFEQLAEHVILVELDDQVATVWRTIIHGDGEWLASRIGEFDVTPESVAQVLAETDPGIGRKAFRTILKNRVNRGGILAPGAGLVKYGEDGKGLRSRWYPGTLKRRILDIVAIRERLTFLEGDGLDVMRRHADDDGAAFFIDPPYTAAGKKAGSRLYTKSELDHEALFALAGALRGDFLMTYDDAEGVRALAHRHGFATRTVAMKNTHHAKMTELLIGRDLRWLDYD